MSNLLRWAAVLAIVVVSSAAWIVSRTIQRAQSSTQRAAHTQEVLTAIDTVLSTVVDAESVVRGYVTSADERALKPFDRAQRTIEGAVDHVAALTIDNSSRQARVEQLRQDLDPDLLKIVFVNLLVNGAHAMSGRGTIRVSSATMTDTCRIAFADEVPGIPSNVRDERLSPLNFLGAASRAVM
jgi:signal transduction histidine kinase